MAMVRDRRYRPLCRFASGGMAEVWLAHATGIGGFEKLVVLKRLLPQFARVPAYVSRFLDEARLAASLDHPNVVQVIDVGVEGGFPFLAMEHLFGHDVSAILARAAELDRPVPLAQALAIVMNVCAGLHHAHDKVGRDGKPLGLVHRDVSPHNVLVTYSGVVKVIDFGIAKATALVHDATTTGVLRGKLGYMSPEQYHGRPVDRRSDLFAVAVMLYELTTGRRPFEADSPIGSILQAANGAVVRPSAVDPSYPADLEHIVLSALKADPAERPASALAFEEALAAFARAQELDVSRQALAAVMESLFAAELAAWRSAEARGRALWEHLQSVHARPAGEGPATRTSSATVPGRRRRLRWWRPMSAGLAVAVALGLALAYAAVRSVDSAGSREAPSPPVVEAPRPVPAAPTGEAANAVAPSVAVPAGVADLAPAAAPGHPTATATATASSAARPRGRGEVRAPSRRSRARRPKAPAAESREAAPSPPAAERAPAPRAPAAPIDPEAAFPE